MTKEQKLSRRNSVKFINERLQHSAVHISKDKHSFCESKLDSNSIFKWNTSWEIGTGSF